MQAAPNTVTSTLPLAPRRPPFSAMLVLTLLLLTAVVASLGLGALTISPLQLSAIVAARLGLTVPVAWEPQQEAVLLAIRLPRTVLAAVVGAGLSVSGVAMQAVFRNPLADPGLIGVSSGAALAAALVLVVADVSIAALPPIIGAMVLPAAAFVGGVAAVVIVYRLGRQQRQTDVATLLLAGIAVNAMAGAGVGFLLFAANDAQLRSITFWSLGSVGGATWAVVLGASPFILIAMARLPRLARSLNLFLLGEAEARHLGSDVEAVKRWAVVWSALAVGASVAATGVIGFVGLAVPHLVRLLLGPDHRRLFPGAALLGAAVLLGADVTARTVVAPAELPIGIVTALLGAPFLLWLLRREREAGRLG